MISLTGNELGLIELALESHIEVLESRFDEEDGYVHPATEYKKLLEKLKSLSE